MKTGTIVLGVGGLAAVGIGAYLLFKPSPTVDLIANEGAYITYVGKETVLMADAMADVLDIIGVFYWWYEPAKEWRTVYLSYLLVPNMQYYIVVTEDCTLKNFEISTYWD